MDEKQLILDSCNLSEMREIKLNKIFETKTGKGIEELQKVDIHFDNLVDLENSFQKCCKICQNEYLDVKIGVDTADNEPSEACST